MSTKCEHGISIIGLCMTCAYAEEREREEQESLRERYPDGCVVCDGPCTKGAPITPVKIPLRYIYGDGI